MKNSYGFDDGFEVNSPPFARVLMSWQCANPNGRVLYTRDKLPYADLQSTIVSATSLSITTIDGIYVF